MKSPHNNMVSEDVLVMMFRCRLPAGCFAFFACGEWQSVPARPIRVNDVGERHHVESHTSQSALTKTRDHDPILDTKHMMM